MYYSLAVERYNVQSKEGAGAGDSKIERKKRTTGGEFLWNCLHFHFFD